jgi:hypothetical protein
VVPGYIDKYLQWQLIALAAAGWIYRRQRDRLALNVKAWIVTTVIFLCAGLVSPIDLRCYLLAYPGFSILAAIAIEQRRRNRGPSTVVVMLLGRLIVIGGIIY